MDDGSTGNPHAVPPGSNQPGMIPNKPQTLQDEQSQQTKYSIPGILHFIQHEWARFEMERAHWEVERAELQARIAFLQGERKGQENLKRDLVRRIKMLEYALKQERAKYHKLKYGTELNQGEMRPPTPPSDEERETDSPLSQNSQVTWRQGRQLLRQYLQEIGYSDTILDVRSNRVRTLLGLTPNESTKQDGEAGEVLVNGEQEREARRDADRRPVEKKRAGIPEIDSEASVLATFDFLSSEAVDDEDEENLSDGEEDGGAADDESEEREQRRRREKGKKALVQMMENESLAGMEDVLADPETEEALAEFDFLVSEAGEGAGEAKSTDGAEWGLDKSPTTEEWAMDKNLLNKLKEEFKKERKSKKGAKRPNRSTLQAMLANLGGDDDIVMPASGPPRSAINNPDLGPLDEPRKEGPRRAVLGVGGPEEESLEAALGLGDLAGLTVTNEAEPLQYDVAATKEAFRKTWNPKYTLRSHFDAVRALAFHPIEPVLITASEDHTLKMWNLQKTVPAKKSASLDVEPIYTFRAHSGPVTCLCVSSNGDQCYSGSTDSTIRCWNIPSPNIDPYDAFDPTVLGQALVGHTDAIWGVTIHSVKQQLLSCSADGTVRLWSLQNKSPLLNTYTAEKDDGAPTSVDFVRCELSQMVAAYSSSIAVLYDLETAQPVAKLDARQGSDSGVSSQINRVVAHPTLPITITAHEDRHIKFFDNKSGKMVNTMVAHLDAVTSLAVDPNGLYLLSGSHDCSIRLWNLDSKTCVQEITSHRKKFDESIFDVAFHPSKPYIASAGADALAKVFV
ncbi:striatin-3-like isoform X1 [Branchiostoma floridae x Branchiostoma belcheri]